MQPQAQDGQLCFDDKPGLPQDDGADGELAPIILEGHLSADAWQGGNMVGMSMGRSLARL